MTIFLSRKFFQNIKNIFFRYICFNLDNMQDNRLFEFHQGTNKEKADKKFGLMVSRSIAQTVNSGYNNYYYRRNALIKRSRNIAIGDQDMRQYLDLMNIDGKQSFVNIDLTPPRIAPKFLEINTQRFMERQEAVKVSAIDPQSRRRRELEKEEAEFRMDNKEMVGALTQETGIPLEDPSAYTPDDKDDLDFYFGYEYQLPEEIKFEKAIEYVLGDNDWNSVCKRKIIEDLQEAGFAAIRVYVNANGRICVRPCEAENTFYSYSKYQDLRDVAWCGEFVKMKIPEFRARFTKEFGSEKALFECIKRAAVDCPGYSETMRWMDTYEYAYFRPYDDWEVEVMEFEFKTIDNDIFTAKKNRYGNLVAVDKKEKMPQRLGDNKEVHVRQVYNIYKGYYIKKTDELLCWELAKNMIRPTSNLADVYFSYSFYMLKNRDMIPTPLPIRMELYIKAMTLSLLKIQQLKAKLRPSGISVDINGLNDLDLGLGKKTNALELMSIYDQTGNVFYRSIKEDGETRQMMPINELPNLGGVQQFQALISEYNFQLECMRADIGSNEYVEGQSVNPKLGLGVQNTQIQASNRTTEFLYEAYLELMKGVSRNAGILLWDNIIAGGAQYRDFAGEKPLDKTVFDASIEMLPDLQQRAIVQEMVQTSLTAGIIDFQDAFKINNIQNIKLKELYLAKAQKRKQKEKMQQDQSNIQATSQAQQQSALVTSQAKQQEIQLEWQNKIANTQLTNQGQQEASLSKFVFDVLLKKYETGKPLPPEIQDIVDGYLEAKANQEEDVQAATEEAMMQEQQNQGMDPTMGSQMPMQQAV